MFENPIVSIKNILIEIICLQLDTVCRVLLDRQWSVGELVSSILRFSEAKIFGSTVNITALFEYIIVNIDKKRVQNI